MFSAAAHSEEYNFMTISCLSLVGCSMEACVTCLGGGVYRGRKKERTGQRIIFEQGSIRDSKLFPTF